MTAELDPVRVAREACAREEERIGMPGDRFRDGKRDGSAAMQWAILGARAMQAAGAGVPSGWVAVPLVGAEVKSIHPITVLNPTETFEVIAVQVDSQGARVRGEQTCWFGMGLIKPALSPVGPQEDVQPNGAGLEDDLSPTEAMAIACGLLAPAEDVRTAHTPAPAADMAGLVATLRRGTGIRDSALYTEADAHAADCTMKEAADAIEALQAEVERLRGDCRSYAKTMDAIAAVDAEDQKRLAASEDRATAAEAEAAALRAEVERLRKVDKSCRWYWPEDDTGSEACADSPSEVVENAYGWGTPTGEVVAVARGGVVEVTYCAALPPAPDAESDDEFWVEEATTEAAAAKIAAELERRSALGKAESPADTKAGG